MRRLHTLTRFFTWRRILVFSLITGIIWIIAIGILSILILSVGADNQAEPADVIIVLGSGLRRDGSPGDALLRRSRWGARLYNQGLAPVVMCTGGVVERVNRSEADACREVLERNGVPADAIVLEDSSRSTEENAINSQTIMQSNGWQNAILVTDSFHMLRADWIFDDYGIPHVNSPVPREQVRNYFFVRHFTREIVALHWQLFKETFNLPFTSVPLV